MLFRAPYFSAYYVLAVLLVACDIEIVSVNEQFDTSKSLLIYIDRQNSMYVLAEDTDKRLDDEASRELVAHVLSEDPNAQILISPDPGASTEAIVGVIEWLEQNGADFAKIGLIDVESLRWHE